MYNSEIEKMDGILFQEENIKTESMSEMQFAVI
jgi:hypothetical protein